MNNTRKVSIGAKLVYRPMLNLHVRYSLFWDDQQGKKYDERYRFAPYGLLRHPKHFRRYGPTQVFFDRTWSLNDIERLD